MKTTQQTTECAICGLPEFNPLHGARVHGISCPAVTGGDAGDCTCEPSPQHEFMAARELTAEEEAAELAHLAGSTPALPTPPAPEGEAVAIVRSYLAADEVDTGDPAELECIGWHVMVQTVSGGESVGVGFDAEDFGGAYLEALNDCLKYAATSGRIFRFDCGQDLLQD